jgi:hypothetical protein
VNNEIPDVVRREPDRIPSAALIAKRFWVDIAQFAAPPAAGNLKSSRHHQPLFSVVRSSPHLAHRQCTNVHSGPSTGCIQPV